MIRPKTPDKKNAESLIKASESEMAFVISLKLTGESASTVIRNVYESFRMLGDALLVSQGIEKTYHHNSIQELLKLKVNTLRPLSLIDSLRLLHHNINYYGYKPSISEAEDAIDIANAC